MSKAGVDNLDSEGKKEIASTYNTLAGLLAGLSFTVLFFYIDKDLNLNILSGSQGAFLMLMAAIGLVTINLDLLLGIVSIVVEVLLFIMFIRLDKAQFHSKRKK